MTLDDLPRLKDEPGLPAALGVALRSSERDGLLPSQQALNELEHELMGALVATAGLTVAGSAARFGKLSALGKVITSKVAMSVVPLMLGAGLGVGVMEVSPLYRALTSAPAGPAPPVRAPSLSPPKLAPTAQEQAAPEPTSKATAMDALPALSGSDPARDNPTTQRAPSSVYVPPSADPSTKGQSSSEPAELGEVDLIERAHRALVVDPQQALLWLREHERRFPGGTFAQEREAIAIEALVNAGNLTAARDRAKQFTVRFPGSAYAAHVASLVRQK